MSNASDIVNKMLEAVPDSDDPKAAIERYTGWIDTFLKAGMQPKHEDQFWKRYECPGFNYIVVVGIGQPRFMLVERNDALYGTNTFRRVFEYPDRDINGLVTEFTALDRLLTKAITCAFDRFPVFNEKVDQLYKQHKRRRQRWLSGKVKEGIDDPDPRYLEQVSPDACPRCNNDLTKRYTVVRTYVHRNGSTFELVGHYDPEDGVFVNDEKPSENLLANITHCDLPSDSDTCMRCGQSTARRQESIDDPSATYLHGIHDFDDFAIKLETCGLSLNTVEPWGRWLVISGFLMQPYKYHPLAPQEHITPEQFRACIESILAEYQITQFHLNISDDGRNYRLAVPKAQLDYETIKQYPPKLSHKHDDLPEALDPDDCSPSAPTAPRSASQMMQEHAQREATPQEEVTALQKIANKFSKWYWDALRSMDGHLRMEALGVDLPPEDQPEHNVERFAQHVDAVAQAKLDATIDDAYVAFEAELQRKGVRTARKADEIAAEVGAAVAEKAGYPNGSEEFDWIVSAVNNAAGRLFPGNWEDYEESKKRYVMLPIQSVMEMTTSADYPDKTWPEIFEHFNHRPYRADIGQLVRSLRQRGVQYPVNLHICEGDPKIYFSNGHHRLWLSHLLGLTHIPVRHVNEEKMDWLEWTQMLVDEGFLHQRDADRYQQRQNDDSNSQLNLLIAEIDELGEMATGEQTRAAFEKMANIIRVTNMRYGSALRDATKGITESEETVYNLPGGFKLVRFSDENTMEVRTPKGKPAGFIAWRSASDRVNIKYRTVEIEHLEINDQFQNRGLGEAVLQRLKALIPQMYPDAKFVVAKTATSQGILDLMAKVFGPPVRTRRTDKLPRHSPDDWLHTMNRGYALFRLTPAVTEADEDDPNRYIKQLPIPVKANIVGLNRQTGDAETREFDAEMYFDHLARYDDLEVMLKLAKEEFQTSYAADDVARFFEDSVLADFFKEHTDEGFEVYVDQSDVKRWVEHNKPEWYPYLWPHDMVEGADPDDPSMVLAAHTQDLEPDPEKAQKIRQHTHGELAAQLEALGFETSWVAGRSVVFGEPYVPTFWSKRYPGSVLYVKLNTETGDVVLGIRTRRMPIPIRLKVRSLAHVGAIVKDVDAAMQQLPPQASKEQEREAVVNVLDHHRQWCVNLGESTPDDPEKFVQHFVDKNLGVTFHICKSGDQNVYGSDPFRHDWLVYSDDKEMPADWNQDDGEWEGTRTWEGYLRQNGQRWIAFPRAGKKKVRPIGEFDTQNEAAYAIYRHLHPKMESVDIPPEDEPSNVIPAAEKGLLLPELKRLNFVQSKKVKDTVWIYGHEIPRYWHKTYQAADGKTHALYVLFYGGQKPEIQTRNYNTDANDWYQRGKDAPPQAPAETEAGLSACLRDLDAAMTQSAADSLPPDQEYDAIKRVVDHHRKWWDDTLDYLIQNRDQIRGRIGPPQAA